MGLAVGLAVGTLVGLTVGFMVGLAVGWPVGSAVGFAVGVAVRATVGAVGAAVEAEEGAQRNLTSQSEQPPELSCHRHTNPARGPVVAHVTFVSKGVRTVEPSFRRHSAWL